MGIIGLHLVRTVTLADMEPAFAPKCGQWYHHSQAGEVLSKCAPSRLPAPARLNKSLFHDLRGCIQRLEFVCFPPFVCNSAFDLLC